MDEITTSNLSKRQPPVVVGPRPVQACADASQAPAAASPPPPPPTAERGQALPDGKGPSSASDQPSHAPPAQAAKDRLAGTYHEAAVSHKVVRTVTGTESYTYTMKDTVSCMEAG